MVATVDFLGWGVFVDRTWDQGDAWLESVRTRRFGHESAQSRHVGRGSRHRTSGNEGSPQGWSSA